MKNLKFSLIASVFLLVGCGGGGGSSAPALTNVKTVEDAKTSYKAISSFESIDISKVNSGYSKLSQKIQKSGSAACTDGGTVSYDESSTKITISYSQCRVGSKYYNGDVIMTNSDNKNFSIAISDYTYRDIGGEEYINITMVQSKSNDITTIKFDGVINETAKNKEVSNMSFDNMVITNKDTYSESWSTIDGGINLKSKCVTGNYQFTTKEKLVDAKDRTDNLESGILDINGATYTFENPYVTVKTATEEKTMLQSKLTEEMESNSCN
jgi:hypothetical protein